MEAWQADYVQCEAPLLVLALLYVISGYVTV